MKSQRRTVCLGSIGFPERVVTFHKLPLPPIVLYLRTGTLELQRNSAAADAHLFGVVVCHDQLLGFWLLNNVVTVHISKVHGSFPVL